MGKGIYKAKLPGLFSVAIAGLLCVLLAMAVQVRALTMVRVSGVVYDNQGQVITDATVYATAPGGTEAVYGPVTSDETGAYELSVGYKSTYDLHFVPAEGSMLASYVEQNFGVIRTDRTFDAHLPLVQQYTLSGAVTDSQANPVPGVEVRMTSTSGATETAYTDGNGQYSLTRSGDTYAVTLAKTDTAVATAYPFFELAQTPVDLSTDAVRNYQLPAVHQLSVLVRDRLGQPVSGQDVSYAVDVTEYASATSDETGIAVLPVIDGIALPEGVICSTFNPGASVQCNTQAYDGTGDVSLELAAPMKIALMGVITDASGNPVADIGIRLVSEADGSTMLAKSDVSGEYVLLADPGNYQVVLTDVESDNPTIKYWSRFSMDKGMVALTTTDVSQDYQLPALHKLSVQVSGHTSNTVKMLVGDPEAATYRYATSSTTPASLTVFEGETLPEGSVCVTFNGTNAPVACNTEPIVVATEDVSYTFTAPMMYTFSGQLLGTDGLPTKDRNVRLQIGETLYLAPGGKTASFSIRLVAGVYDTYLYGQSTATTPGYRLVQPVLDITESNASRTVTLPVYTTLTVTLLDAEGNPLQEQMVRVNDAVMWTDPALTDAAGQVVLPAVDGLTLPVGTICAGELCNEQPVLTQPGATVTLQQPAAPQDPEQQ